MGCSNMTFGSGRSESIVYAIYFKGEQHGYVGGHGGGFGARGDGFPGGRYRRRPCSFTDTVPLKPDTQFVCEIPQAASFS
jgi:hypothetical protein